jgi:hypothetical protein
LHPWRGCRQQRGARQRQLARKVDGDPAPS